MECGKCNEIKYIEEICKCGILNREVSPFWGFIDFTLSCPLGKNKLEKEIAEELKTK